MNPGMRDFQRELYSILTVAMEEGRSSIEISARDLHNGLGAKNCYPTCCDAMFKFFDEVKGDQIISGPPSLKSPTVCLRYYLPKPLPVLLPAAPVRAMMPGHVVPRTKKGKILKNRVDDLINSFEECLDQFYARDVFTGPCIYFHEKAIRIRDTHPTAVATLADDQFFDATYATLTAWGMHKLGPKGAKLRDISEIRQSFRDLSSEIEKVQGARLCYLAETEVEEVGKILRSIIENLKVGANSTILVAGTKALHHLLPALCPPVDRRYSLQFFYNSTQIARNEGLIFEEIFPEFQRIADSAPCRPPIPIHLGHLFRFKPATYSD